MPDWFWYIPGPIAIVVYVTYYYWARRKSSSNLTTEAQARGWRYKLSDRAYVRRYSGWPFTGRGRNVRNVITGTDRGREFAIYEFSVRMSMGYRYADDGLLRNRCRYQVVSTAHGSNSVPDLTLANADVVSRLSGSIFSEGIDLGSEEFRRKFSISTRDIDAAAKILAGPLSEWLTADQRASMNPLKLEKGDVVTWRTGAIDIPAALDSLNYLNDVIDRLPPRSGTMRPDYRNDNGG